MIFWIFGMMMIGSAFLIAGFAREGWRNRVPPSVWNAALVMAIGFELHAIGTALQTGVRVIDVIGGAAFPTSLPIPYFAGSALVVLAKSFFVWLVALQPGRKHSRTLWRSYLLTMAGWTGFVAFWKGLI